ncbi:MAG: phosphoenolpyruvate--protein phosphotransferase [Spirochaetes bacterium]|nr:phosphoenolpyruvate--protein phosphotransferase [Spirochaetota bacterium]
MKTVSGISASPGIYIGKVFLYKEERLNVPKYKIEEKEIESEFSRLLAAVESAKIELETIKETARMMNISENEIAMLDSHILMISDEAFISQIKDLLSKQLVNVDWVFYEAISEHIKTLTVSQDMYMEERVSDLRDIAKRVLSNLLDTERVTLADLENECIIAAHDLLPSDAVVMDKKKIKGIILNAGGKTSHTAIIARAFEIPAVVGLFNITRRVKTGDNIIIDGNAGAVIINPDEETTKIYLEKIKRQEEIDLHLQSYIKKEAVTNDGKKIIVAANIEIPQELESVKNHGASGIGLFRSEFLLLQSQIYNSEERQFEIYSKILQEMEEKPVTIRTLDIGGDKIIPYHEDIREKNPLLGWRGIRFCLTSRYFFKKQLRALYRASVHGNLKIMFPMISCIEEVDEIFQIIEEVKHELKSKAQEFKDKVPLGIMLEVPAAVLAAEFIAKKVDFFSIGTNDLIQYTIAIDRGNEKIAYLYQMYHPALLRLIKMSADAGRNAGIPVSICGEMGGDPRATVVLLGLGIEYLSMSPASIPAVKKVIRNVDMPEAKQLVDTVLQKSSGKEIEAFVEKWFNERFKGSI